VADTYDAVEFGRLQRRLHDMWPALGLRSEERRVLVVVSSISFDVPGHVYPVIPAYEERYLFLVLLAARAPASQVIYVTSQPIAERVFDYYLRLIPGIDVAEFRRRITLVAVSDWSPRPLVHKILERPRLLERLRKLIGDPQRAVLIPFMATPGEARLAVSLGIPMYAPDPALRRLGTKSGGREVFAAAGVPLPRGVAGIRGRGDLVAALVDLQRSRPMDAVIVKTEALGSGLGNASVRLAGATDPVEIARCVDGLEPEDRQHTAESYLDLLAGGGVVEERLVGSDLRSPSVQLRASPAAEVEILSTHDQMLGGHSGQTFIGCTFPADAAYRGLISSYAEAIGRELAGRGVIGRFGIDFVVRKIDPGWDAHAIEVNLRNGGTTHPALTLLAMTAGRYDPANGDFLAGGVAKHYIASDHLEHPAYRSLTPDDALDVLAAPALAWDPERLVGPVFHMTSAVAVAGSLGVTAIGDSPAEAREVYAATQSALDEAAEIPPEQRCPHPWRPRAA